MNVLNQRRKIVHKVGLVFLLSILSLFAHAQAFAMSEEEKITALIESVRDTPEGTQFIRNGKAHSVSDAISHLNLKYSKAKSRIKTAEDFIKHVASGSSVSGEVYLIRYPDGATVTAAAFFTEKLRKLKSEK
ncbi:MAG: DUF5329 domain-containing protein [Burkholderiales bacterium]|jgi:uncharacterized protein YlzI (FlbEa/FlbD family)|nr:DUF5329 domain-containing protein [Burkholderiales bacterium]